MESAQPLTHLHPLGPWPPLAGTTTCCAHGMLPSPPNWGQPSFQPHFTGFHSHCTTNTHPHPHTGMHPHICAQTYMHTHTPLHIQTAATPAWLSIQLSTPLPRGFCPQYWSFLSMVCTHPKSWSIISTVPSQLTSYSPSNRVPVCPTNTPPPQGAQRTELRD